MQEIPSIKRAQDRAAVLDFESALSTLTFAIGSIERIKALEPEQQDRLRMAVIRISNAERKHSKGEIR